MRLLSVTLSDVRRFTAPVTISGIAPGLNVLSAPNEEGKSTLFDALHALFFQKHRGKPKEIMALRPHAGGAPLVSVEVETGGTVYTVTKRWLSRPLAEVRAAGRLIAKSDEAEAWIAALTEPPEAGGPAGLLWVRQGLVSLDEGEKKEIDAAHRARRDLLSSVAGEVEALTGGRRMDRALAACEAELGALVTASGKSKSGGPLKAAEDETETLQSRLAELRRISDDLHGAMERRRALRTELAELQEPEAVAAREERLAAAEAAAGEARAFALTRDQATERLRAAELRRDGAQERLATLRTARKALAEADRARAELARAADEAMEARRQAEAEMVGHRAQLDADRAALVAAETARGTAQQAARARDAEARRKEIGARLDEARRHAAEAQRLATAAATGPDAATLDRLEGLAREERLQRDLLSRAAPRLRMDYAPGADPIDHAGRPLADGVEQPLDRQTALDLPGLGVLTITPGAAAAEDAALASARSALAAALASCGQPSLAAAREAARDRIAATAARKEALAALKAIAPDGIVALETALDALPPPPTAEEIDAPAPEAAEAAVVAARKALAESEPRAEAARTRVEAARLTEARAAGRLEDAERRLDEARAAVPAEPDAAEATLLTDCERAAEAAELLHAERTALDATAPDLDAASAALARARDVVRRSDERIQVLTEQRARLDAEIELRAGEGVEEDLSATTEALDRARERLARLVSERDALLLLKEVLDLARSEAREHYFEPVTRELAPLMRLLWPDAELVFNEDTVLPVRLLRDGIEEEIGQLSGGTREQIALLVRLAFARLLARSGRQAPVILDDALVYTDDARIERMFDALHRQAGDLQILVLSCRQRAFRDLGGQMLGYAAGALPEGAE